MRSLFAILLLAPIVGCADSASTDDTAGAPDDTGPVGADCVEENGACVLTGTYTEDMTLTADKAWLLRSLVNIGDDASDVTLTIEPGTKIYGESATNGLLVVTRGAKIEAVGTAAAPIVFTSDQAVGSRARGDWGGLVLNGRGRINACADGADPCEATGEGGTGTYGGDDNTESSGTLKYVVIQFGGTEVSTDNEVNGLGLQAVGSGTVIDYVQVHKNLDDGIEFFGGAPNVKHLVISHAGDDNIDWTLGYQGKIQHALVVQADDAGNHGFELDNNEDDYAATPLTGAVVSNVTLVGSMAIAEDNLALLARKGTSGQFWNIAATGFTAGCLGIRDDETYANFVTGDGAVAHSAFACTPNFEQEAEGEEDAGGTEEAVFAAGTGNIEVADLEIDGSFQPEAGSPLLGAGAAPSDNFFDAVDYIGAFDGTTDWIAGWTDFSEN
ncbi:MAG: hypothetical protein Q8P41_11240 [Pseudomonadota bacterium]|nr:hypothetical protein [Pseudomonadota bacterium]